METPLELATDHPAYAGHFPGRPILPGVALLAEVMHEVGRSTGRGADRWTIASAKFLQPVTPGTSLTLVQSPSAGGGVRFEVRAAGGIVASGTLSPKEPG
jgi:3-hydroxymyristoyl/3-hydroxydecanoyl-(acyl carrier protein) dehydratase